MKRLFISSASKELAHNDLSGLVREEDKPAPVYDCPHFDYCMVKKFSRINCLTESSIKTCATYKYYNKYGEGGNVLGI